MYLEEAYANSVKRLGNVGETTPDFDFVCGTRAEHDLQERT